MTHIRYGSNGSTQNQTFQTVQEQCFLWERVTPFGVDFGVLSLYRPFTCTKMLHNTIKKAQNALQDSFKYMFMIVN